MNLLILYHRNLIFRCITRATNLASARLRISFYISRNNDDLLHDLTKIMKFYAFLTSRAWHSAAARRSTNEREEKERKAKGTCYTCITKSHTIRGRRQRRYRLRMPERHWKNIKTSGTKIIVKISVHYCENLGFQKRWKIRECQKNSEQRGIRIKKIRRI